jgi:DNA-binding transcriptional MerR regulator
MTLKMEFVNASRAAAICGLGTVAMIDYLERSEVFVPSKHRLKRRGKRRAYGFRDLLVLKAIGKLLAAGTSVAALKAALQQFQSDKWSADRASLANGSEVLRYVVLSGREVLYARGNHSLFDLTKGGQMVFNFVIDLDALHTELCNDLDQLTLFGPKHSA